ncbi:hypothetical protein DFAR_3670001 [Desulfarculales bacterium]
MLGKKLDIRYMECTVGCSHQGQRVASHRRILEQSGVTTLAEHIFRSYQEHAKWTSESITNLIHKIGEATAKLAEGIMNRRVHPQQGFRACLGLIILAKNMVKRGWKPPA